MIVRVNLEDQKVIASLSEQKAALAAELRALEKTVKATRAGEAAAVGALSAGTSLAFTLVPDAGSEAVMLNVTVSTDAVIVNIIVIDQG